jgi:putative PIN family toxin of toxin-antitoxin system
MTGQSVVWDSSVLIPLILPQSKSTALYNRLDNAGWIVASTPAILQEVREKLQTKPSLKKWLSLSDLDVLEFVDKVLPALVRVFPGVVKLSGVVPDDPDDDVIVAAAIESLSPYIVSEDKHLLTLQQYQQIRIVSRDEFQEELTRLGVE